MSSQSKFKYKISSGLCTFSGLFIPEAIRAVTPADPSVAPLLDFLTPVDDNIQLNLQEFTAHCAPLAKQHIHAVLRPGHGPKPINSISGSDITLQNMESQKQEMIDFHHHAH